MQDQVTPPSLTLHSSCCGGEWVCVGSGVIVCVFDSLTTVFTLCQSNPGVIKTSSLSACPKNSVWHPEVYVYVRSGGHSYVFLRALLKGMIFHIFSSGIRTCDLSATCCPLGYLPVVVPLQSADGSMVSNPSEFGTLHEHLSVKKNVLLSDDSIRACYICVESAV